MTPYAERFTGPADPTRARHCGHTMGTPGLSLPEALHLFAGLGFAGAELRCATDGCFDEKTADEPVLDAAREAVAETGVRIVCLTPYYGDYSGPKREATMDGLRRTIALASALDCPFVRAYGGHVAQGAERAPLVAAAVEALRELGDEAAAHDVCLVVETHGGTLTHTAAQTLEVVGAVDHPHVGVLFDYPWIWRARAELPAEAVRLLAPYLAHVHVKGYVRTEQGADSRLLGPEDEVPWAEVCAALTDVGYAGFYSHEYEKHWYPHLLPEPAVGFANDRDRLREYLAAARRAEA